MIIRLCYRDRWLLFPILLLLNAPHRSLLKLGLSRFFNRLIEDGYFALARAAAQRARCAAAMRSRASGLS